MSKLLAAASVLSLVGTVALAEPARAPNEPEHTIDAIGADVSSRAQWFGDAIDHVLSGDAAEAKPPAAAPAPRHHPQP